jgi:SAM-dependent methyltransferase
MQATTRIVLPELLDELDPNDPRAKRSRRDLRRVHRAIGSLSILREAIVRLRLRVAPTRILELGAGDASLLLRLARTQPEWHGAELSVLDRHDLVSQDTRERYREHGWKLTVLRTDIIEWARGDHSQDFDLCVTSLFLHHFDAATLSTLTCAIAARCDAFVACEPRRNGFARLGSRLIGFLGANAVTRSDAVKSVAAGFVGQEVTATWPNAQADWWCDEYAAPPFTHCFVAARKSVRRG